MKKLFIISILFVLPSTLFAGSIPDRPHWSLELKGSRFIPDVENWAASFGDRYTSGAGGSLSYKIWRPLEVGLEGNIIRDSGKGWAPLHNVYTGHLTHELYQVNAFLLARAVFSEEQWLVPYAGGGWTRMYYRQEIQYQGVARGFADGFHARGGLQFSMDVLDPHAANSLHRDFGVFHTYFFIEAEYTRAIADTADTSSSVNLGGTSWSAGLLFEF